MTPALRTALERAGITDFTKTSAQVARALDGVLEADPVLRAEVERDLAVRKALQRPFLDYGGLGGTRHTSVPLFEAGANDADLERRAAALGIVGKKLLDTTRADVQAARADFAHSRGGRGGAPLAKRGGRPTVEDLADSLQWLANALNTPPEY